MSTCACPGRSSAVDAAGSVRQATASSSRANRFPRTATKAREHVSAVAGPPFLHCCRQRPRITSPLVPVVTPLIIESVPFQAQKQFSPPCTKRLRRWPAGGGSDVTCCDAPPPGFGAARWPNSRRWDLDLAQRERCYDRGPSDRPPPAMSDSIVTGRKMNDLDCSQRASSNDRSAHDVRAHCVAVACSPLLVEREWTH